MDSKDLTTLEFPKVLERLAGYASFSASRTLALSLFPSSYRSQAVQWQAETGEARRLLAVKPETGIGGARDVRPLLEQVRRAAILTPTDLLNVRQTLIAGRDLKRAILSLQDQFPNLADIAGRIQECPGLVHEIGRSISDRGEVLDDASPELVRIRRELDIAHQRLLDRLNRIVQSGSNAPYLQEAFVTQRQGRYVIPVRAEFKGRIPGIIHDQSASGATLFVEPTATVELNNRWRQLQVEEEQEVQRVLAALGQMVNEESDRIRWTVEAIAELDLAFAKAKYADELLASEPTWRTTTRRGAQAASAISFDLAEARHPLLDPETVVPAHLQLDSETHILVITGPNTGGKTVALKTVGLLVVMAQAGLQVPVREGSSLPFFDAVYADIGDEQSIEQSLSTFSSHMTNIVRILEACDENSMVILDELGAGTDPVEGSALARAILEYLRQKQVTTFVATHYSELKVYAHHTPGVVNASVEFNAETLAPTYRLMIGLPGRSNAFAIARRLGLNAGIIDTAQAMIDPETQQTESMLWDIQSEREAAARERRVAASAREQVEKRTQELDNKLAEIERERHHALNAAREEARKEIEEVRQELQQLQTHWRQQFENQDKPLPADVEDGQSVLAALEESVAELKPPEPPATQPAYRGPLHSGDQVWVKPYNASGEVISSQRGQVEVQLGHFRVSVRRNQVDLLAPESSAGDEIGASATSMTGGQAANSVPVAESPGLELDLRGQTTEEGLRRLDLYLDDAYMAELPWVRIIHGKGTGVLRAAVRDALNGHPLVTSYHPGDDNEGGDGVTIVKLAVG